MVQTNRSDTSSETPADTAGTRAMEVFSILSDETRLSILLALWEASESYGTENAVPFSDLREAVGVRDSGRFNYHLKKLGDHFIRKTADGYELRHAGWRFMQTVIAGTNIDASVDATELDKDCKYCGAPTEIFYEDQRIYKVCTECDGCLGEGYNLPEGTIAVGTLDPTGLTNRRIEDAYHAAWTPGDNGVYAACEGVCPVCSGPIEASIQVCDDHASEGVCATCGRLPAIMAHFRCPVCKHLTGTPPYKLVAYHPAVIAFYYERGTALQYEVDDFDSLRRRENRIFDHEQELVADDPIRVRVTVHYEGDELHLTLDERMSVIDVSEPG